MTSMDEPRHDGDPAMALELSQKAPLLLAKASSFAAPFPLSIFSAPESPETWMELAQLFYACLRTGDDKSAHLCLEKLTLRFGTDNERIMAMRGLYQEAVAVDSAHLASVLQDYNKILSTNPMNVPVHKRRIALIKSIGKLQEAIESLVDFLDSFPGDVEGWCELSDLYQSQGLGAQAIFCLEEALLQAPYAWNLHARLGELDYMNAMASNENSDVFQKSLVQAIQRFCRSIELCDDYLRGFYGLKLATTKLLQSSNSNRSSNLISNEKLRQINEVATKQLQALVTARSSKHISETNQSEVIAARALLDKSKS